MGIAVINFEEIYSMIKAYRIVWIRGRFGGGKTSFAVYLAAKLLADGVVDNVVSNIRLSFSSDVKVPLIRSCILLDESWTYIDSRRAVESYAAFVRKLDHYLLLPSVYPPHQRLTMLYIERIYNAYAIGLPLWIYRWVLNVRAVMERGYFIVYKPNQIFEHYNSLDIPGSDGGISKAISETLSMYGYQLSKDTSEYEDSVVDEIQEVAQNVSDDIIELREISRRSNRSRRR